MAAQFPAQSPNQTGLAPAPRLPIDMLHLAKQALGDPGLELEVLRLFDEVVRVNVLRLEEATSVPDVQRHLHTIRGASVGVGAWGLAQHAHIMEVELRDGAEVNAEHIQDIRMSAEEVRAFIAERIAAAPDYAD
jgi:chemotaxis protein histidine kinase CheA